MFDVLSAAVEMLASADLQNLPPMLTLRDIILSNVSPSSSSFCFMTPDLVAHLQKEELKGSYPGFFNTYGLPETIVSRNKTVHFWLEEWGKVCGQQRAIGHFIQVFVKRGSTTEGATTATVVEPGGSTEFEWRSGCIKEYMGGEEYLVELEARVGEDLPRPCVEVVLHLPSCTFHFDDKNHPFRLTVADAETDALDDSLPSAAECLASGTCSDRVQNKEIATRVVELPSLDGFDPSRVHITTPSYSRYYFDLLNMYHKCNGFGNVLSALKNPAGEISVNVNGDSVDVAAPPPPFPGADNSPLARPELVRSASSAPVLAGMACLSSHLRFLHATCWAIPPAFVYALLVEFSDAVVLTFSQMADSDFRDFQVEKFNAFLLMWSELFVLLSDQLVELAPAEYKQETRDVMRGRGCAFATEMVTTLIISMLKCSIIIKRYLGIGLLKELILTVCPELSTESLIDSNSNSASVVKESPVKSSVNLVDGLVFSSVMLESCLVKLEILHVLFTNKYSISYNSEFLGCADIILFFLLHRKRINSEELEILWGGLKVLGDNSGQHIVYKFLLQLCPLLSDSQVISIVILIRSVPSIDVDDQLLTFVKSFAVLVARHFKHLNDMKTSKQMDFNSIQAVPLKLNSNVLPFGIDILYEFLLDRPIVPDDVGAGSFADVSYQGNGLDRLDLFDTAMSVLVDLVQSTGGLRTEWNIVTTSEEGKYFGSYREHLVACCISNIEANESVALSMRLLMRMIVAQSKSGSGLNKSAKTSGLSLRWFRLMLTTSDGGPGAASGWNLDCSVPAMLLNEADPQALSACILGHMTRASQLGLVQSNLLDIAINGLERYHELLVAQCNGGTDGHYVTDINTHRVRSSTSVCKISHDMNVLARLEFVRFILLFSSSEDKPRINNEPNSTSHRIQLTLRHLTVLWMCFMDDSATCHSRVAFLRFLQELTVLEHRELAQLLFMYSKDVYVSRADTNRRTRASDAMIRAIVPQYLLSNPSALFGVGKNITGKVPSSCASMFAAGALERLFADYFAPFLMRDNHIRIKSGMMTSLPVGSDCAALAMPKQLLIVSLILFLHVNMTHNNIVFTNYGISGTKGSDTSTMSEFSVSASSASWIRTGKLLHLQLLWKVVVDADVEPHCQAVSEFGESLLLELHHRCVGRSVLSSLKVHRYFIVMCFNHLAYAIQSIGVEGDADSAADTSMPSSLRLSRRISLYISLLRRYIERFQKRLGYEITVRCIPAVSTHSLAVHKDKMPYFSLTVHSSETVTTLQEEVARHLSGKDGHTATTDVGTVSGDSIILSKIAARAVSARTVIDKFATWMGSDAPRAPPDTSSSAPEEVQGDYRQYHFAKLEKAQCTVAEVGLTPFTEWKQKNVLLYGKKPPSAVRHRDLITSQESSDATLASVIAATTPGSTVASSGGAASVREAICFSAVSCPVVTPSSSEAAHSPNTCVKQAQSIWDDYIAEMESVLNRLCSSSGRESDYLAEILAIGMEALGLEVQTQSPDYVQQLLVLLDGFLSVHGDQEVESLHDSSTGCVAVEASAWSLLNFFPTSGSILYVQVSELTPHGGGDDLNIILRQISAPYQLLYSLNIIGSLINAPESLKTESSWIEKFVHVGGVEVLIEILTRLCEVVASDDMDLFSSSSSSSTAQLPSSPSGCHMHRANAFISNIAFVCNHLHKCLLLFNPSYAESMCGVPESSAQYHLVSSLPASELVEKLCLAMDCVLKAYNRANIHENSSISKDCVRGFVEHGWTLISGLCMMTPAGKSNQCGMYVLASSSDVLVGIVQSLCLFADDAMKAVGCRTLYFVGQKLASNCVRVLGDSRSDPTRPSGQKHLDSSQITLEPLDLNETSVSSRPGSPRETQRETPTPQSLTVSLFYFFYGIVIASGSYAAESVSKVGNISGYFTLVRELREFFIFSKHSMFCEGTTSPGQQNLADYFVEFHKNNVSIKLPEGCVWSQGSELSIADTCLCQMLVMLLGKLALGTASCSNNDQYTRYLHRSTYLSCDRRTMGSRDSLTVEYFTEISVVGALDIFQLLLEQTVYADTEEAKKFSAVLDKVAVRVRESTCDQDCDSVSVNFVEFVYFHCLFARYSSAVGDPTLPLPRTSLPEQGTGGPLMPLVIRQANRQKVYALLLQLAGSCSQYRLQLFRAIQSSNYAGCGMSTYPWNYCPIDPEIKSFRVLAQLPSVKRETPRMTSVSIFTALSGGGASFAELPPLTKHSGLINQANTCYMNSFLQQLYHVRSFTDRFLTININPSQVSSDGTEQGAPGAKTPYRYSVNQYASLATVLANSTADLSDDEKVLVQLQFLFAQMRMNSLLALDTGGFCGVFKDYSGEAISIFEQKDINEFAGMLFDKLENSVRLPMKDETGVESVSSPVLSLLSGVFGGKICCSIRSTVSDYRSSASESFYMLSCEVKGFDTLDESLASFSQAEKLEGEESVEDNDGVKVEAVRRYSIGKLPNTMIIHLKRFEFVLATMSRKKVNDKLSFPIQLNMYRYTTAALEGSEVVGDSMGVGDCEYRLRGVVLHAGAIDRGHYYSFVQEREAPYHWYKFNDSRVSLFEEESIPDACFGGFYDAKDGSTGTSTGTDKPPDMKIENAYMLFYEKVEKETIAESRSELTMCPILWGCLERQQALYLRDSFLFNEVHFQFMYHLMQNCPVPITSGGGTDDITHTSVTLMLFQQYIQLCFKFAFHTVLWAQSTSCFEPFFSLLCVDVGHSSDLGTVYSHTLTDLLASVDVLRPPTAIELQLPASADSSVDPLLVANPTERILLKWNSWWFTVFKRSPTTHNVSFHFVSLLKVLVNCAIRSVLTADATMVFDSRPLSASMATAAGTSFDASKTPPDDVYPLPCFSSELLALDEAAFVLYKDGVEVKAEVSQKREPTTLSVLDRVLHMVLSCIECMFAQGTGANTGLVALSDLLLERTSGDDEAAAVVWVSLFRIGGVHRLVAWLRLCHLQIANRKDIYGNIEDWDVMKSTCCKTALLIVLKLVAACGAIECDGKQPSGSTSVAMLSDVDLAYVCSPTFIDFACEHGPIEDLRRLLFFLCSSNGGSNAHRAMGVLKAISDKAIKGCRQVGVGGGGKVLVEPVGKTVKLMSSLLTNTTSVAHLYTQEQVHENMEISEFTAILSEFVKCLELALHIIFKTDSEYIDSVLSMLAVLSKNKHLSDELIERCKYRRSELLQYLGRLHELKE